LGERNDVPGWVPDPDFFGTVEGRADGHDDLRSFHGRDDLVEILDLDVQE
jgi:hypothetical protein